MNQTIRGKFLEILDKKTSLNLKETLPEDEDVYLFKGGLELDSLDMLDLLVEIEAVFGVEVPPKKLVEMRSVQGAIETITKLRGEEHGNSTEV